MLNLPVFNKLLVLNKENGNFIGNVYEVKEAINQGRSFLGYSFLTIPCLLTSNKPFKNLTKGGMYFEGNPIPWFVTPVKLNKSPVQYIYEIHFL